MKQTDALNLDYLKANCKKIHMFGLGFIQVKLDAVNRVHFYTNRFGKTVGDEDIHNHRYGFMSGILKGCLEQKLWNVNYCGNWSEGTHLMTQESCIPGTRAIRPTPAGCTVKFTGAQVMQAGTGYRITHGQFHQVKAFGDTITWVQREPGYAKPFADVVYLKGTELTCPFSLSVDEETLWKTIKDMLP